MAPLKIYISISGCSFIVTVLYFHYIDEKFPYFSYFEQNVKKLSFYKPVATATRGHQAAWQLVLNFTISKVI